MGSSVTQTRAGTQMGGKFTVEYAGQRTAYLPYAISEQLWNGLEQHNHGVDVTRSDMDQNKGYVWSVTFLSEMGDIQMMVTDSKALTGTDPRAVAAEYRKGVAPPFNSTLGGTHPLNYDRLTDLSSLRYYIVYHQRETISTTSAKVPYYVRVSAINSVGEGSICCLDSEVHFTRHFLQLLQQTWSCMYWWLLHHQHGTIATWWRQINWQIQSWMG